MEKNSFSQAGNDLESLIIRKLKKNKNSNNKANSYDNRIQLKPGNIFSFAIN